MDWIDIWQTLAILLNLVSMLLNIHLTRKTREQYSELTHSTLAQLKDQQDDYQFHTNRFIEEIELLKTNEGLYDVRNDEEQYQIYLELLRRK